MSNLNDWNWLIAIGISILLAVVCYETFEKWYLKKSNQFVLILSFLLFSFNIGLLYQEQFSNWISPPEITNRLDGLRDGEVVSYYKASKLNNLWNYKDQSNLFSPTCGDSEITQIQYCSHTGLDTKNGKYKLMIIGNSWAGNTARLFYKECAHKANSIIEQWRGGCEPLYPMQEYQELCEKAMKLCETRVNENRPDYMFIISRFHDIGNSLPDNVTDLNDDPIYQKMKSQLEVYSKNVKNRVFIMNQIAEFRMDVDKIPQTLLEGKNLTEFDKTLIARDPGIARLRYEKLALECSKCELFDFKSKFFNETTKTWRFYDEANAGLAYLTTGVHLTAHGQELVRPIVRDLCDKL